MQPIESFETERLFARRLHAEDAATLRLLHADPLVMRTLSADGNIFTEDQTRQMLARQIDHWARYGYGIWLFLDRSDRQFVGYCGLRHTLATGTDEVELGYATVSRCWNQGYTTEMARNVLRVGFDQIGLDQIVAFTLATNRASQRVMEKNGLHYERDFIYVGLPHVLYRLKRVTDL